LTLFLSNFKREEVDQGAVAHVEHLEKALLLQYMLRDGSTS